ncbi:hypothetical protein SteCoe_7232 [Stentor coeruleus]|uniref:Uncharacterized protein n=1 Tax=Stentor coeruleus TaxID=5963 RepID=A0A1R2CN84_9CILI|nr:hypothetical protein SteCoe_7232 [Stentor coeruleus]
MANQSASCKDGIPAAKEAEFLQEGMHFIKEISKRLLLKQATIATAQYYFHKVAFALSFRLFDRLIMASVTCFLSAKTNEQIIRIIEIARSHLNVIKIRNEKPGSTPRIITDEMIEKTVKTIALYEFNLLAILDYNLIVPLPYAEIRTLLPAERPRNFFKVTTNFANDFFRSRACLKYTSTEIAQASLYLSCEFFDMEPFVSVNFDVVNDMIEIYKFYTD